MRLIDADAIGNPYENTSLAFEFMILKKILDDAPTVDAVEVVRCKDCKYSSPNGKYGCNLITDDGSREMGLFGDDYCSFGERETDEIN